MRSILSDEKGSVLPMFAVVLTVFFMVAAVAVDFARYVAAGEKLQTATDSAAIAAALTAKRYVRLEIDRGSYRDCCPTEDGKCRQCCRPCDETITVEGPEADLIDRRGYKRYCCSCRCGHIEILDRWVEYERNGADARLAAEMFFNLNKPKEMDESADGASDIRSVSVRGDRRDPLYPSVIVRSQGRVKTLIMNIMDKLYPGTDLSSLGASRCSQGGTFYYDIDGNWHRASMEGCD